MKNTKLLFEMLLVGLIFVTALLLLIINCMFLFKEYEKAIEFKRANKGENKKIG